MWRVYSLTSMCLSEITFILLRDHFKTNFLTKIQLKQELIINNIRDYLGNLWVPFYVAVFVLALHLQKEETALREPSLSRDTLLYDFLCSPIIPEH